MSRRRGVLLCGKLTDYYNFCDAYRKGIGIKNDQLIKLLETTQAK